MNALSRLLTRFTFLRWMALMLSLPAVTHAAGPTGLLNDTGQASCYDGSFMVACSSANAGNSAQYPSQDGRFGRDAAAAAGQLAKVGGGAAGFDFTKVCMNGSLNCVGSVSNAANPAASSWACTKDNLTNLIWSLENASGFYLDFARITLPTSSNSFSRCGFNTGWRLPTRRELLNIEHLGRNSPTIDIDYFPNTHSAYYWSADSNYDPLLNFVSLIWVVSFGDGSTRIEANDSNNYYVRLVRSGP